MKLYLVFFFSGSIFVNDFSVIKHKINKTKRKDLSAAENKNTRVKSVYVHRRRELVYMYEESLTYGNYIY